MFWFNKLRMKKEENKQLLEAINVAQKLGAENKQLRQINEDLMLLNNNLKNDFESAVERVKYLAEQLRMREAQQIAFKRFNDNDRNY
jgi:hypothetical protein